MTSQYGNIFRGLGYFYSACLLLTILFDLGWIIYCMRECWRVAIRYRICKQTPDLHPVYRDVQYLSRQRKLYNLKTHFVKYVLMVLCLTVEVYAVLFILIGRLSLEHVTTEINTMKNSSESKYHNCYLSVTLSNYVLSPFHTVLYTLAYYHIFTLFLLLCILTRYLAARYLNHSSRKIILEYASILAAEFVLILICSTTYTIVFSSLLFPLIILTNWLFLVRDSRTLTRVLRSNLREIELHSKNKALYREQLSAYKFYRIFQKVLLLSFFLLVVTTYLSSLGIFLHIFGDSNCILNIIFGINSTMPNIKQFSPKVVNLETVFANIVVVLYSISTSLPIISITFIPLVRACILRYKSRHTVYRYNYENIKQSLLN